MGVLQQFWHRITPPQLKRLLIAGFALLLIPVLVAVAMQEGAGGGSSGGGWQSPDSIFAARSPGRRDDSLVSWIKKRLRSGSRVRPPDGPRERVLAGRRSRPAGEPPGEREYGPVALLSPAGPALPFASASLLGFAPAIPGFSAPGFEDVLALPPSPSGAPGTGNVNPVPPGPAVPELATWLQMVLAIGALGLILRRVQGVGPVLPQAQRCASGSAQATLEVTSS